MHWLVALLFISLFAGQLGSISVSPGITLYLHDVVVVLIVVYGFYSGAIRRAMTGPGSEAKLYYPAGSRLVKPIVAFAVVGVLSLLANAALVQPDTLWKGSLYLLRWVAYAGVYLTLVGNKRTLPWLAKGLFLSGSAMGLLGLVQFFLYPDLRNLMYLGYDPHYYRVFSTLFDPNFAGILFVLTLIVGATFLQQKREIGVIGGMGVSLTALLLTYSRSSYLSFLAAAGVWVVLHKKWKIGLIGLLLFFVAIVYLPRPGREALSLDRFDSTVSRLNNWSESVQRMGQKPILGYGFNVLPFLQQDSSIPSKAGAGIDNSFLFVGVTTGLVGLMVYGWLVWSMVLVGKRTLAAKKTSVLGTAYLATLVAVVVHSLFVNSLFYPWVMLWMWLVTAQVEKTASPSALRKDSG